jgi:hypothetical protein
MIKEKKGNNRKYGKCPYVHCYNRQDVFEDEKKNKENRLE